MKLLDGGEVALDWGIVQSINQSNEETSTIDQQTLPVLLILTGITGGSEEAYCMHLVMDGIFSGYRPVVLNQRGCGGLPLKVNAYQTFQMVFTAVATCCIMACIIYNNVINVL